MDKEPLKPQTPQKEEPLSFWREHRISLLLVMAITLALTLTIVSVFLYNSSGAAQLDLSRPGYRAVSNKVERDTEIDRYSSSGPVTDGTIKEFIELYEKQADRAKSVDAFSGDPLNPEVLIFGSSE